MHIFSRQDFYAHPGFFFSLWLTLTQMIWCDLTRPITDSRGRFVTYPLNEDEENKLTVNNAVFIASLSSISEQTGNGDYNDDRRHFRCYSPVRRHRVAIPDILIVSDCLNKTHFTAQQHWCISRLYTSEPLFQDIANKVINFLKESKNLGSTIKTARLSASVQWKNNAVSKLLLWFLPLRRYIGFTWLKQRSWHEGIVTVRNQRCLFNLCYSVL